MSKEELEARASNRREGATYPAVFSGEAVERIVDAVASALMPEAIPANLDRQQLGRDLGRALFWYRTFENVGPSEPWKARWRRGNALIKKARSLHLLLAKDDDE